MKRFTRYASAALAFLLVTALLLPALPVTARADEEGAEPEGKGPPPLFSPPPKDGDRMPERLHFALNPDGKRHRRNVLFVWGGIDSGDSQRFRAAVDQAKPVEEVVLYSPGGVLEEGLQIGRIMRSQRLSTHVQSGMKCISACNFMFMGGVLRSIDPGGVFGVHMFTSDGAPLLILVDLIQAKQEADDAMAVSSAAKQPAEAGQPPAASGERSKVSGGARQQPASPPQRAAELDDQILEKLGCPELVQLQPKDLEERVSETIKQKVKVKDPRLEAELNPMLRRMTLHVLCMQQLDARQAAEIARFLVDMSLSLRFLTEFANIPNAHWRPLTRDELRDFNVVNTE
jgi:hypothetical protein